MTRRRFSRSSEKGDVMLEPIRIVKAKAQRAAVVHLTMPAKPTTIDEYLAAMKVDQRVALQKLRRTIRAFVPAAEECINYGVAAFRLDGKCIAGLGAAVEHCSYYPMSGAVVAALRAELKGYATSKGAIHFEPAKPLPASLVRKLLKARIAEIGAGKTADRPRARAKN